ncbi:hypothetical protein GX865_05340 [Candidatus Saccharibacteria bacterium]|mgnify:CR=1 FL=1|jgi:hypothetical protein|nr:hypothetical protein [Candidatus Saccharibacteria bacterium]
MSNTLKEQLSKLGSVDVNMMKKEVAELGGRVPEQLETNKLIQQILGQLQRTNFFLQVFAKYYFTPGAYQELLKSLIKAEFEQSRPGCNDSEDERQHDSQT